MKWSVGIETQGDRVLSREEIVELADAVAASSGIATGIGTNRYGAQLLVEAGRRGLRRMVEQRRVGLGDSLGFGSDQAITYIVRLIGKCGEMNIEQERVLRWRNVQSDTLVGHLRYRIAANNC